MSEKNNERSPESADARTPQLDPNRCAVCGWPLKRSINEGCVRGNCSQRPLPDHAYDAARAIDENGYYEAKYGKQAPSVSETGRGPVLYGSEHGWSVGNGPLPPAAADQPVRGHFANPDCEREHSCHCDPGTLTTEGRSCWIPAAAAPASAPQNAPDGLRGPDWERGFRDGWSASQGAVANAAHALVTKLRAVHADDEYKNVWSCAQLHRGPYAGPKYEAELDALESILAAAPTSSSPTEEPDRTKRLHQSWCGLDRDHKGDCKRVVVVGEPCAPPSSSPITPTLTGDALIDSAVIEAIVSGCHLTLNGTVTLDELREAASRVAAGRPSLPPYDGPVDYSRQALAERLMRGPWSILFSHRKAIAAYLMADVKVTNG